MGILFLENGDAKKKSSVADAFASLLVARDFASRVAYRAEDGQRTNANLELLKERNEIHVRFVFADEKGAMNVMNLYPLAGDEDDVAIMRGIMGTTEYVVEFREGWHFYRPPPHELCAEDASVVSIFVFKPEHMPDILYLSL